MVDPTGGGNCFLGGYMAGWLTTRDIDQAVQYGHVAASFALEQIGLPRQESTADGTEMWNGQYARERLEQYKARLRKGDAKS